MSEDFDPYAEWFGIGPAERPIDHYRLLGVPRFEADTGVLAAAADQRMADLRKRQTGPRALHTQTLLNEVAAAKLCLLNPATKVAYDTVLQAALAVPPSVPSPPAYRPATRPPAPSVAGSRSSERTGRQFPRIEAGDRTPLAPPVVPVVPGRVADQETADEDDVASSPARWALPVLAGLLGVAVLFVVWAVFTNGPVPESAPGGAATGTTGSTAPEHRRAGEQPPGGLANVAVTQQPDGRLVFDAASAELHGSTLQRGKTPDGPIITNWTSSDDEIRWRFRVARLPRHGLFRVRIEYQADEDAADGSYVISVDDQPRVQSIRTRGAETWVTDEYFLAVLSQGDHTLSIRGAKQPGQELIRFRSLEMGLGK